MGPFVLSSLAENKQQWSMLICTLQVMWWRQIMGVGVVEGMDGYGLHIVGVDRG